MRKRVDNKYLDALAKAQKRARDKCEGRAELAKAIRDAQTLGSGAMISEYSRLGGVQPKQSPNPEVNNTLEEMKRAILSLHERLQKIEKANGVSPLLSKDSLFVNSSTFGEK